MPCVFVRLSMIYIRFGTGRSFDRILDIVEAGFYPFFVCMHKSTIIIHLDEFIQQRNPIKSQ